MFDRCQFSRRVKLYSFCATPFAIPKIVIVSIANLGFDVQHLTLAQTYEGLFSNFFKFTIPMAILTNIDNTYPMKKH